MAVSFEKVSEHHIWQGEGQGRYPKRGKTSFTTSSTAKKKGSYHFTVILGLGHDFIYAFM